MKMLVTGAVGFIGSHAPAETDFYRCGQASMPVVFATPYQYSPIDIFYSL